MILNVNTNHRECIFLHYREVERGCCGSKGTGGVLGIFAGPKKSNWRATFGLLWRRVTRRGAIRLDKAIKRETIAEHRGFDEGTYGGRGGGLYGRISNGL